MEGRAGKRKRRNDEYTIHNPVESDEDLDGELETSKHKGSDVAGVAGSSKSKHIIVVDTTGSTSVNPTAPSSSAVGGALKRNADGSVAAPRVVKKKEKGKKVPFRSWGKKSTLAARQPKADVDSDTSFDSSDSAYDTVEEKEPGSNNESEESDQEGSQSGEEESESDGDTESSSSKLTKQEPTKRLGFKDWALKQLSVAKGYDPSPTEDTVSAQPDPPLIPPTKKRKASHSGPREMRGPLGEDLELPNTSLLEHLQKSNSQVSGSPTKRAKIITVKRPTSVEEARLLLPIVTEEQPIMEAILLNLVVIICGETGSGKTTQVPQFLYEAGFGDPGGDNSGMIGITQPRRVAAMSMASRVAHELSLTSSRVSYQIRYDATVSPSTTIKFMTDGVLLRELATDFLLSKYSVIIIDEVHERSMNTDILIGVLSRVLKLREQMWKDGKEGVKPLRLIIMSATLRVSDFAENRTLFPSPPPVINVAARQHPVTIHFNRRTPSDYVNEAIKKASKIHSRLPPGGILMFLTGQNEISGVCKKLEAMYGKKALEQKSKRRQAGRTLVADVEPEEVDLGPAEQDLAFDIDDDHADQDMEALDSEDENAGLDEELGLNLDESDTPMHIVPLYSLLPNDKQMRVFQAPPPGHRLVVVSTNVAETSLTIPGIRYVIDCGRAKERRYDVANGIQAFQVNWTSKASAAQRAGRAGRTGPGHCYRLYSSALFEHYFESFSQPEILRVPIEGVVLQMKSMNIDAVVNFPFPTPPDRYTLKKAETVLTHLGALTSTAIIAPSTSEVSMATIGGHITALGKTMALFPLSPRYSKMLVSGQQHGCLPYVITIVSALSVGDPFLREEALEAEESSDDENMDENLEHIKSQSVKAKEARRIRRRAFFESQQTHASLGKSSSDIFSMLSVAGAYEYAGGGHKFCADHFVRPKAMEEIHKLRGQISNIVQVNFPGVDTGFIPTLRPPTDLQLKVLRQLLTAAFIDQVAVRKDIVEKNSSGGKKYASAKGVPYQALGIPEDVFIHPTSALSNSSPPEYIVYHEIVRTTRPWLKGVTIINPVWLSSLGKPTLCTLSKPTQNSAGIMMSIPRFGPDKWELPPVKAEI
ncbi:hypothetical protein SERLADRAFT_362091 [Serpula lacrymans var. lacrymans S7.9]|uniref:RNA helicase n=1 Tax=Serpula lacrymans var. lacrymans (strain S7.9) TaxID=578457 RepID=F8NZC7_SERL9|nr:uncharacterized protein SERLADRAFT_362091 [Serpula lacrymans var. lacrymans S7.9]EGO23947.1 hypothetical protein SERLADRAFT_362091 [Serpula lacrymans var. lacrymans S7.9]